MIKWDSRTHRGDRAINEDYHLATGKNGQFCFALADGLGAHIKGEEASKHVCEYVIEGYKRNPVTTEEGLKELVLLAHESLLAYQKENNAEDGLRSTLVVLVVTPERVLYASVGDSRMYQFMGRCRVFQTKDQSVCQKLVDAGQITPAQIRNHEDRSRLMTVLGQEGPVTVQTGSFPSEPSIFLLCSDGLWENVLEGEMEIDLHKVTTPGDWLRLLEKRALLKAKKEMDNCTAIAVFAE